MNKSHLRSLSQPFSSLSQHGDPCADRAFLSPQGRRRWPLCIESTDRVASFNLRVLESPHHAQSMARIHCVTWVATALFEHGHSRPIWLLDPPRSESCQGPGMPSMPRFMLSVGFFRSRGHGEIEHTVRASAPGVSGPGTNGS